MTNEVKQKYVEIYNAMEVLADAEMIDSEVHGGLEHKLLRTIMGHFAVECNKAKDGEQYETDN